MDELIKKLVEYGNENVYPFHMPGHKRQLEGDDYSRILSDIYHIDITEIYDFDDLHAPSGILKDAEDYAAKIYNSSETHFLINGSTAGILCAVSALSEKGDTLLVARDCHKSVFNGAFLNGFKLRYVFPEYDEKYGINGPVTEEDLSKALKRAQDNGDKVAGIVITSPTYEGLVSDIKALSLVAHSNNIPLIVDEAHGAHFGFADGYPDSSVKGGADIVIHSLHKTLPSPTQTALIHINSEIVSSEEIRRYLGIYQTSSPSYILMAGMDHALHILETEGRERLEGLLKYRKDLQEHADRLKNVSVCPYTEPGKILIKAAGMMGPQIADYLRNNHKLEMEMSAPGYVLGIATMMDSLEGFNRLKEALSDLEIYIEGKEAKKAPDGCDLSGFLSTINSPIIHMEYVKAVKSECEKVDLSRSLDKVAGDMIMLYPPGTPIIVPGELITRDLVNILNTLGEMGYEIRGIKEGKIKVIV